ncbi:creatinine amidohydrolase [Verrucomicrobiota bacterium]|jgi:creatinine amidohydrolase|nr:creatinine amidohydrolase [Verrucomicrobiota bacterium]
MNLTELTWPDVAALDRDTPVIFPIAALEQHGRHIPVFTDSMLMGEIANRAEGTLGARALFAPLQWLGNSHHHMDFPGTLSAEPRVYLDLLCGLLENFIAHGFRRLLLLNGHGGNDVPGKQAVFEVRQRHRERNDLLLLFCTYWNLDADPHTAHPDLHQKQMGHACEWETSMVLRLAPHLVKNHTGVPPQEFGNAFEPASRGWTMTDRSEHGHVGDPRSASAEKGEALFGEFTKGTVSLIERMIRWNGESWEG